MTVLRGGTADRIPWNIYAWLLPQTEAGRRLHAKSLSLMGSRRIYREIREQVTVEEVAEVIDGVQHYHTRIETPLGVLTEESVIESNYGSHFGSLRTVNAMVVRLPPNLPPLRSSK